MPLVPIESPIIIVAQPIISHGISKMLYANYNLVRKQNVAEDANGVKCGLAGQIANTPRI